MKKSKWVIGVDEVGRGPLAGPVAVGVAVVPAGFNWSDLPGVTDSKKLSPENREAIFRQAKALREECKLDFAVSMVSARVIDRIGIVSAINLAMDRSLKKLEKKFKANSNDAASSSRSGLELVAEKVVDSGSKNTTSSSPDLELRDVDITGVSEVKLDGGLKAPGRYKEQETIIKGDQKEPVIGLASIVAKVTRDRYMIRLCQDSLGTYGAYANYGFDQHKGYGTKAHRAAIKKHGLSDQHRSTFCTNITNGLGES